MCSGLACSGEGDAEARILPEMVAQRWQHRFVEIDYAANLRARDRHRLAKTALERLPEGASGGRIEPGPAKPGAPSGHHDCLSAIDANAT